VLATLYSMITPLFEASDELWHYPMVKYLADHGMALPVQDPATAEQTAYRQEGGQPPLYYMIGAAATFWIDTADMDQVRRRNPHADIGVIVPDGNVNMVAHNADKEAFPWGGTALAMHLVRLLSVAMGAGTVYLTYRLARELIPDVPVVAVGAAALTAFTPMFLFISGVVNNDNLSTLLATLLLVLIVRLLKRDDLPQKRDYVILGAAAGAGMLSKFQIGFLLPLIALTLLIISVRWKDWRPVVVGGAIAGGLTILIAGWWYVRNFDLYGDATGINVFLDIVGRRAVPADLQQLWTEREAFVWSYWGFFGGVNVPLRDWMYTGFNGIAVAALVGLAATVGKDRAWMKNPLRLARAFAALWAVIVFVSLISWTRQTWASQGRLWFSAIAPLSIGMAVGLAIWWKKAVLGAAASYFVVMAVITPLGIIRPAYTLDRNNNWDETTLETGPDQSACFREPGSETDALCMNFQPIAGEMQPGEYLKLAPEFTVKDAITREWSIFVHLTNEVDIREAQRDVYPGGGLLATSDLKVGERWNNPIAVKIPEGTYTPETVNVYLGFYHLPTFERMDVNGAQADSVNQWIHLGQITLTTPAGDVPNPVSVNFGGQIELIGYAISDRSLQPGDETTITLYWNGQATGANYHISVQVLKQGTTTQVGQVDWEPSPPTTEWTKGRQETSAPLKIFPDAAAGQYHVMVRVYPADDPGNPLRIVTGEGGQSENSAWLSKVRVE